MKPLMLPVFLCARLSSARREKRLVLIDQDGSGPGGSNQMSVMVLYALLSIMLYMA
jgi:purine nucleosidase